MKPLSVPSPIPWMPASVCTFTNSQFFQPAPTVKVSISVIFIGIAASTMASAVSP